MPDPVLVQHVSTGFDPGDMSALHVPLAHPSLAGNGLIVGVQCNPGQTITSVQGNVGSAFTLGPSSTASGARIAAYYLLNAPAGITELAITFSGTTGAVRACASEFYNIALSSALDGSSGGAFAPGTTAWASGSFTTTTALDLIWQFAYQTETGSGTWGTSFAPAAGYTLLHTDLMDGSAAQYTVQASAGATNPAITSNPASSGTSVTLALKSAAAGTPPPAGIRIVRRQMNSFWGVNTSEQLQFPCRGNLLVAEWDGFFSGGGSNCRVSAITDSQSNTWQEPIGATGGFTVDGQLCYAPNATPSPTLAVSVSLTATSGGSLMVLYDIEGAATSPFDNQQTLVSSQGSDTGTLPSISITPTQAPGLILCQTLIDIGAIHGIVGAGYQSDVSWYPEGGGGFSRLEEDNARGHVPYTDLSTKTFVWIISGTSGGGAGGHYSVATAFRSAATDTLAPGAPTRLRLVRP